MRITKNPKLYAVHSPKHQELTLKCIQNAHRIPNISRTVDRASVRSSSIHPATKETRKPTLHRTMCHLHHTPEASSIAAHPKAGNFSSDTVRVAMDSEPTSRFSDRYSQQPPAELRPSSTAGQALAASAQGPERRVSQAFNRLPSQQPIHMERPR